MHKKNERKGQVTVKEEELEYSEGVSESEKSGSKKLIRLLRSWKGQAGQQSRSADTQVCQADQGEGQPDNWP